MIFLRVAYILHDVAQRQCSCVGLSIQSPSQVPEAVTECNQQSTLSHSSATASAPPDLVSARWMIVRARFPALSLLFSSLWTIFQWRMTCPIYPLETIQRSRNPLHCDQHLLYRYLISSPPSLLIRTRSLSRRSYLLCSSVLRTESGRGSLSARPMCYTCTYASVCTTPSPSSSLDTEAILGYLPVAGILLSSLGG